MLIIIVGFILILLGIIILVTKKTDSNTELSALGITLKSNNSSILLICLGAIFVVIGSSYKGPAPIPSPVPIHNDSSATLPSSKNTLTLKDPGSTAKGRFPEGSERSLTVGDIQDKSDHDLKIMRNEIFARHGYIFKTEELRNYFSRQDWYTPVNSNEGIIDGQLSDVERRNINFIKQFEK